MGMGRGRMASGSGAFSAAPSRAALERHTSDRAGAAAQPFFVGSTTVPMKSTRPVFVSAMK
jgi:hypothetical protein